jgi:hypothetical protein
MIMGNEDCPYFGGFYFFHHEFPDNYPVGPPKWKFLTNDGKTRFNPNLYQITSGKVCLSILGTWSESSWAPAQHISSVMDAWKNQDFESLAILAETLFKKLKRKIWEGISSLGYIGYKISYKNHFYSSFL